MERLSRQYRARIIVYNSVADRTLRLVRPIAVSQGISFGEIDENLEQVTREVSLENKLGTRLPKPKPSSLWQQIHSYIIERPKLAEPILVEGQIEELRAKYQGELSINSSLDISILPYIKDFLQNSIRIEGTLSGFQQRKLENVQRAQVFASNFADTPLTIDTIEEIRRIIGEGVLNESAYYIRSENFAPFVGKRKRPPPGEEVKGHLISWLKRTNEVDRMKSESTNEKYKWVAQLAADFQYIHPFKNGNGRVGHVLTNLLLKKMGLPEFDVPFQNETEYMKAMDQAIGNKDYNPLVSIFKKFEIGYSINLPQNTDARKVAAVPI